MSDNDERRLRQNDTPKTITLKAFNTDGIVNLTQFSSGIVFKMVGPVTVTGAATGDAVGNLSYTFTSGQLATPGDYEATFRGTGPGEPQTFPEGTNLRVKVIPAL